MMCSRCKTPLIKGFVYCPHCGTKQSDEDDSRMEIYKQIIRIAARSRAYMCHKFCKANNGNTYLKIYIKPGLRFTDKEFNDIDSYINRMVGKNRNIGLNPSLGHMTITLYR